MIDAIDRKILDLLQANARLSNAEMAEAVGLKVRAAGPKQLEKLISAIKGNADSSRSVTDIVLSSYKESTLIEPAPAEVDD